MTTVMACVARKNYQMPAGLLTIAVQQLLDVLGLRMGLVERHSDRDGAAVFSVSRNRGSGGSLVEIVVPYCSYEGRTVILSVLTGTGHKQRDIRWQRGGRPTVGSKAIAFFAATEECVVRWSSDMHSAFNEKLTDMGFTGACAAVVPLNPHRNAALEVRGVKYELPRDETCEKAEVALNGGCTACSKAELESLAGVLDAGLQVVHAVNESGMGEGDGYLLLSRKADLPAPTAAPVVRRRARVAMAA